MSTHISHMAGDGRHILSKIGRYTLLSIYTLIVLIPLYLMIVNSLKPSQEIFSSPLALPQNFTLDGYKTGIDSNFLSFVLNSIIITGLSIVTISILAGLASYALVYWESPLTRPLSILFLVGLMIPARIASINIIILLKDLGLNDHLLGLLPIYVAMGLPMAILIMTEYFRTIPRELTQAAYIDGAGSFRIFWQFIMPLSRPAIATVAIFNLVNIWNDFWFPQLILKSESERTLMFGINKLIGQYSSDWTAILSTLTLATLPILILYLVLSKQFIKGLTAGAVKE